MDQPELTIKSNLQLLNSVGTSQQNSTNTSDAEMNFEISDNLIPNPAKKQKLSPDSKMSPNSPNYNSSPTSPSDSNPKLAPFIHKMELLIKNNENVFWSEDGKFMVIDGIRSDQFSSELERVGLSNKHESFIRQMNTYGFRKEEYHATNNKKRIKFPNQVFAYFNKYFTRDFKDLQAVHSTGKRKPIQQERETVSQLQKHTSSQSVVISNLKNELDLEKLKIQALQGFVTKLASDNRVCGDVQNDIYRFLATVLQNNCVSGVGVSGVGVSGVGVSGVGVSGVDVNVSSGLLISSAQVTPNFTPPMSISPQNFVRQNLAQALAVQNLSQNSTQMLQQNVTTQNLLSQNALNQNSLNQNSLNQNALNQNSLNQNSLGQNTLTQTALNPNSLNVSRQTLASQNYQNLQNLSALPIQNLQLLNPLNISIPETSMQPQKVQSTEENQNIQVTENMTPTIHQQLCLFLAQQQQQQKNL